MIQSKISLFYLAFIFFFCLSQSSLADQLIIEPDMGRVPITAALQDAQKNIDLVMYGFTDQTLLNRILSQKNKNIKIILENHPYKAENENNKAIQLFIENHLDWQGHLPHYRLIHQKTLLIDDKKAIVMTFNFTSSSFSKERNFALVIDNPEEVDDIEKLFLSDWQHRFYRPHTHQLIISPLNSRQQLIALIRHARQEITLYAQTLNDYAIVGELAHAMHRGVHLRILTSSNLHEKAIHYLIKQGALVQRPQQYYIHAKVMILDNEKAMIGSINFTQSSLDSNRELSVITQDPSVIQQLNATFNQDWEGGLENKNAAFQMQH